MPNLCLHLGVKTDPAQYRFSYPWLFRLMAEQQVKYAQLGTFFEIYQLPDEYFQRLRQEAENHGVQLASIFTAHRELGGFFIDEPGWAGVARRNFERLIEVGGLLGVKSVGSNPGAVYRDRMGDKPRGIETYLRHMKELMQFAHEKGIQWLTMEPMSSLAEPPTLPDEITSMAEELTAWHETNRDGTAGVGYCADIAHGYADRQTKIRHGHLELLKVTLPHLVELHLKNADSIYSSTFGFGPSEREAGIVEIGPIRRLLLAEADTIPVDDLVGYLEVGGPKLGRDYSDDQLADQLRASWDHLREAFVGDTKAAPAESERPASERLPEAITTSRPAAERAVRISPSVMCADLCHLELAIRALESLRADMLHVDVADGHFVPNLLLGLDLIRQLRPKTALPLDVHMMVENPDQYLEAMAAAGVDMLTVHAEARGHLDRTLTRIRELGMKAGVALNPATPLSEIEYVVQRLDLLLVMTVNPGFAGQKMVASGIRKIADCRRLLSRHKLDIPLMIDGNVSFENIPKMVAAGGDILVAGTSSWFNSQRSMAENVELTNKAIAAGLAMRE